MKTRTWVAGAVTLALSLGCRTAEHETPAGLAGAAPVLLAPQRTWRLVENGEVVGLVVRFGACDDPSSRNKHFYSVRNPLQQELGAIDGLGRAWRYEPHSREPRWVATGTVAEGARAILVSGPSAELQEVQIAAVARASR
jgi:hypothetical protein